MKDNKEIDETLKYLVEENKYKEYEGWIKYPIEDSEALTEFYKENYYRINKSKRKWKKKAKPILERGFYIHYSLSASEYDGKIKTNHYSIYLTLINKKAIVFDGDGNLSCFLGSACLPEKENIYEFLVKNPNNVFNLPTIQGQLFKEEKYPIVTKEEAITECLSKLKNDKFEEGWKIDLVWKVGYKTACDMIEAGCYYYDKKKDKYYYDKIWDFDEKEDILS